MSSENLEHRYQKLEKKLVWIFGTPRSGSTWLANEILKRERIGVLNEPLIGQHLGTITHSPMVYYNMVKGHEEHEFERFIDRSADRPHFFFSSKYEKVWSRSLRAMILDRIDAQFKSENYDIIVIKAPNESHASDIIMKCLPASRLIFLMRDGRDVIDSRQGAFHNPIGRPNTPEELKYRIIFFATLWKLHTSVTDVAYNNHNPDLRLFVKYEELRYNAFNEIKKIYEFLGMKLSDDELKAVVERTRFENVPDEEKGEDKNKRKATPGSWRETFSKKDIELMNRIMKDKLVKFAYDV